MPANQGRFGPIPSPGDVATVYAVDDDPGVLGMLKALVGTIGVECRAFADANSFLAGYRPGAGECLICDLRLPDIDGLEVQRRLQAAGSAMPIIFLTGHAEVDIAVEAMKHGAFDFLQKPFGAQALLGKVQAALERSRREHGARLQQAAISARMDLLTPRERDLIPMLIDGKSSRDIAEALGLSVRTVENHRTRILDKLHVASTVELVRLFLAAR